MRFPEDGPDQVRIGPVVDGDVLEPLPLDGVSVLHLPRVVVETARRRREQIVHVTLLLQLTISHYVVPMLIG